MACRGGPAFRGIAASLVTAALAVLGAAGASASELSIRTKPALLPSFAPNVHDYATRCEPAEHVNVFVSDHSGTPVSVDEQPVLRASFEASLPIGGGQGYSFTTGAGADRSTYTVRCLPANFPQYSARRFSEPQAAYYLMTPSAADGTAPAAPYVALFDSHGVPVWWYGEADGAPVNADITPTGRLTWYVEKYVLNKHAPPALTYQVSQGFGLPGLVSLVEHSLNGTVVNTLGTSGSPTDFHEGLPLADGNFLMTTYSMRNGVDLSPTFFTPGAAIDSGFQVIRPNGSVAYSWNSDTDISPSEGQRWWFALDYGYPGAQGLAWDYAHIDSVVPDGDGYLVSLAHTDGVFLVRASDDAIEWKLGGTQISQSLRIVGDRDGSSDFGGQSDAQVWPDGTVSVFDPGIDRKRAPRVLRFRIDLRARTATLIQAFTVPETPASTCCGSARMLPGGDWVVDWGNSGIVDELSPSGAPALRIAFAYPYYSYRAVPVLPGQLSLSAIEAGMNKMNPRPASGSRPPALSKLRASYKRPALRVRFVLAWRGRVRFTIASAGSRWSFTRPAAGGTNAFTFSGEIAGHRLTPGGYTLTVATVLRWRSGFSSKASFRIPG